MISPINETSFSKALTLQPVVENHQPQLDERKVTLLSQSTKAGPTSAAHLFFNKWCPLPVMAKILDYALPETFWPNDRLLQVCKSFYATARSSEDQFFISRPGLLLRVLTDAKGDLRNIPPQRIQALQKVQSHLAFVFPGTYYTYTNAKHLLTTFPKMFSLDLTKCDQLRAAEYDQLAFCKECHTHIIQEWAHELIQDRGGDRGEEWNKTHSRNPMCDSLLQRIATHCPDLKALRWSSIYHSDKGLKAIVQHCQNLISLEIGDVSYDQAEFLIKNYPKLQSIHLIVPDRSTDAIILLIASNLHALRSISCRGRTDEINDSTIELLIKGCPELRSINLSHNRLTSNAAKLLAAAFPRLESLNLCNNPEPLKSSVLEVLGKNCPHLLKLHWGKNLITIEAIRALAKGCPQLREIYFDSNKDISKEQISELVSGCHKLEKISLEECPSIDKTTLETIATSCPELRYLNLTGCYVYWDYKWRQPLEPIATLSKNLQTLYATNNYLSDQLAFLFAENCTQLREIYFAGKEMLTKYGFAGLVAGCPELEIVKIKDEIINLHPFRKKVQEASHTVESIIAKWKDNTPL